MLPVLGAYERLT